MKKRKQKNNLAMIIAILVIILAALGLMFVATMYYQGHKPGNEVETTAQRQPIQIPDITNPPSTPAQEIEIISSQTESAEAFGEITEETGESAMMSESVTENQSNAGEVQMNQIVGSTEDLLAAQSSTDISSMENQSTIPSTENTTAETPDTTAVNAVEETTSAPSVSEQMRADEYLEYVYQNTLTINGSHIVDLTAYTAPTADELIAMIESYTVPERSYLDGASRSEGDFSYAIKRRNLGPIHDPVELKYGILTENASVRAFPTWQKLSNGTSANDPDALQETMLSAGEGVIVLHQSEDQIWSFVQAGYYYGWIQTSTIGFCSQEDMTAFIAPNDFAVITVPYVEIGGINLRMGTKLPVSEKREGAYVIKMPQQDAQGNLTILDVEVGTQYLSEGYLELSSETIEEQAKKLLGVHYGWGDSNAYMDCTSTLRAVYNCFGIIVPRNSSWMPNSALKITDLREMGVEEKRQVITALAPGSILLINGHAMMYIGQEDGVESMLHNVTQYLPSPGSELVKPMKCVITPIDICNSAGSSYLELYRYAISVDWDRILP